MCLAAGQRTVPDEFTVHSCHCYFILAGSADIPIMFHVEKVRDGRSFMTRTVQARQRGRAIFTTTMSFVREEAPATQVRHALPMPVDEDGRPLQPPADDWQPDESISTGPYESGGIKVVNRESPNAHEKKTRQWIRARGTIKGGHQAHLNALAYVSDSYFIGTISRIHRLWRFPFKVEEIDQLPKETLDHIQRLNDFEGGGMDLKSFGDRPQIGMMVSLDHTIYFHEPRRVKADDWMLAEMDSPWAGDGRGVVTQRIFAKDGTLLATCVQEVSYLRYGSMYCHLLTIPHRDFVDSRRHRRKRVVRKRPNCKIMIQRFIRKAVCILIIRRVLRRPSLHKTSRILLR